MKKLSNKKKLDEYIAQYEINKVFSADMRPFMELFVFHKNEYICKAGEEIKYLFFFVEGKAKVYTSLSNGKSLLLCFYKPFKVLGDVEFIHYDIVESTVQVIEEAYCVGIPMESIRKHALEDGRFLRYMCDSLGEKLLRLGKYSSINLLYTLENRLASYILASISTPVGGGSHTIVFEGNLTEIAELLGTSYRHLLRTLNALCDQGAIKKSDNHYEILDIGKLEVLAGDLYE